jgi:hypothetical protein
VPVRKSDIFRVKGERDSNITPSSSSCFFFVGGRGGGGGVLGGAVKQQIYIQNI